MSIRYPAEHRDGQRSTLNFPLWEEDRQIPAHTHGVLVNAPSSTLRSDGSREQEAGNYAASVRTQRQDELGFLATSPTIRVQRRATRVDGIVSVPITDGISTEGVPRYWTTHGR